MSRFVQNTFDDINSLMDLLNLLHSLIELVNIANNVDDERIQGRRWWVRPINVRRELQGAANNLVQEMRHYDEESFFNFTRLSIKQFEDLLQIVGPHLQKHSIRASISPEHRLLITLRYLATGDSFKSLHYLYRVGYSTIIKIVLSTCEVIYELLKDRCVPILNETTFTEVSAGFERRTNFPHIIGAIDGKHIAIRAPPNSGTQYYNYKKHFSIVLLGVCDSKYRFIYFNVGAFGSESDGGIYRNSELPRRIEDGTIKLPPPRRIYGSDFNVPYVFVADAAFPLREYQMTPFCGRNLDEREAKYNLELSKGRSAIENAFGVLSARWRVLLNKITLHPKNADKIVLATVLLHNYIIEKESNIYISTNYVDHYVNGELIPGTWREGTEILPSISGREGAINASRSIRDLRNKIKNLLFSIN